MSPRNYGRRVMMMRLASRFIYVYEIILVYLYRDYTRSENS
jgi:hypothetical protein